MPLLLTAGFTSRRGHPTICALIPGIGIGFAAIRTIQHRIRYATMNTTFRWFSSLGGAALCCCTSMSIQAATPPTAELRAKAIELFGPLPDKMPGSEADTPARVELGRKLYFEKRLSIDQTLSCNSCHMLDNFQAGVDNQPTSDGVGGKKGDRNSPTVLNAGFHLAQFWDGRAADLKEQAKGPVLNPVEMAMPAEAVVVKRLQADSDYHKMFAKAFPGARDAVTYDNMAEAIAAFERTLITRDRFDDFQKGDDKALTDLELKGLHLFTTFGCTTCHVGPVIGGNSYQKAGLIHPWDTTDIGREKVTNEEWDRFKFKVPSLRNAALTAPYFHNGKTASLKEAVTKMAYHQLDKKLTDDEADALVAFLYALTDKPRAIAR
jgi:cytochrome c peroxidase